MSKKERIEFLEEAYIRLTDKVDEVTHAYNLLAKAFDILNGEIKEYIKAQAKEEDMKDDLTKQEAELCISEMKNNEHFYKFILGNNGYDEILNLANNITKV